MCLRSVSAILAGGMILLGSVAAVAADRGPSTAGERKRALDVIRRFEADPLNANLKPEIQWLTIWVAEIPDVEVHLCMILDKLPKGEKKHSQTLFTAMVLAQTGFVIEHRDQQPDLEGEYQAGIDAELRAYEKVLTASEKDRQPYLDDLVARRNAGTLKQFVEDRLAAGACKN